MPMAIELRADDQAQGMDDSGGIATTCEHDPFHVVFLPKTANSLAAYSSPTI